MAVNIEVRVDPERQRQAQEAIERARSILGDRVTDAFREIGQSMVATGVALSTVGEIARIVRQSVGEAASLELEHMRLVRRTPIVWTDSQFRRLRRDREQLSNQDLNAHRDWKHQCFIDRRINDEGRPFYADCGCYHCRNSQEGNTEEADSRAYYLLRSCLSPNQRQEFEFRESFTVVAKSGRRYRIQKGYNFNIIVLDKDGKKAIGSLCAGPDEEVPVYDSMLSQKLWLENDEEGFLWVANRDGFFDESPIWM